MERFDFVVVGGGHNGLTIASYLAKSGASVAVAENRLELGGCMDFVERNPGFVTQVHAALNYGNAAPGFEQLELWRFGHRISPYKGPFMMVTSDERAIPAPFFMDPIEARKAMEILGRWSLRDVERCTTMMGNMSHIKDLLRSIYWVPPWPSDLEYEREDLPWAQTMKRLMPSVWGDDWLDLPLTLVLEELLQCDPLKAGLNYLATLSGPAAHWAGQAVPALTCVLLILYSHSTTTGGMHMYGHALARSAMHHGAKFFTNSPVSEILVKENRAIGVRLAEHAQYKEKVLMADKAVISAVDTQQTFMRLVGRDHLEKSFIQKVSEIDLRGGSLFYSKVVAKDYPRLKGEAAKVMAEFDLPPFGYLFPMDNLESYDKYMRDIDGFRTNPELGIGKPGGGNTWMNNSQFDPHFSPKGYHVLDGSCIMVPPPEYHIGGPDALAFEKKDIMRKEMLDMLYSMAPNMKDALIHSYTTTPLDEEFRNAGLCGGSWYGPAHSADQWWSNRPIPELARYRAPIDRLYLCHQSQYPGGLCLMAVGYNLMHILIDDGLVEPGSWWYPSPWHVKDGEKKIPRLK